jgi:parallel beta-helix repeat protein
MNILNKLFNISIFSTLFYLTKCDHIYNSSYIEIYALGGDLDDRDNIQNAICLIKKIPDKLCGKNIYSNDIYSENIGTIRLKSDLYLINSNINLYSNMIFEGIGMFLTTIRLRDYAPSFYQNPERETDRGGTSGLIRSAFQDNIVIRDMTIDGNRYNQSTDEEYTYGRFGIYLEVVLDVLMSRLRVMNCQGYGFDPHGKGGTNETSDRLQIINSIAENNGWDGITLDKLRDTVVSNNIVRNNDRHGINIVTGSRRLVISDNTVINNGFDYGNGGCGIIVQNNQDYSTQDITIISNIINLTGKYGICIKSTSHIIISNNHIYDTYGCISFDNNVGYDYGVSYSIIIGNICNSQHGIKIKTGSSHNIVSNNIIRILEGYEADGIDDVNNLPDNQANTNKYNNNIFVNVQKQISVQSSSNLESNINYTIIVFSVLLGSVAIFLLVKYRCCIGNTEIDNVSSTSNSDLNSNFNVDTISITNTV